MRAQANVPGEPFERTREPTKSARGTSASVLADVFLSIGAARATLVVDLTHTFFFDHPLDHVPGTLLLAGILELIDAARLSTGATCDHQLRSIEASFLRFCELNAPVAITARLLDSPALAFACEVRQGCETIVLAKLEFQPPSEPRLEEPPHCDLASISCRSRLHSLVEAQLVHRARTENVLLGYFDRRANALPPTCTTLPVAATHFLAGQRDSALYLLEASRQYCTLLCHQVMGVPVDGQLALMHIALSTIKPATQHDSLTLKAEGGTHEGANTSKPLQFAVGIFAHSEVVARIVVEARPFEKATYARLRARQRRHR